MKKFLYRILCGFFLGLSVFAPGFSGSVIAITMGIYQDIVRISSNPFKNLKQNIVYCIPLAIGAALSGVLFILGFKWLFENFEKATFLLFVGLMVGNIPVIFDEVKKHEFKVQNLIGCIVAFGAALALGLFATTVTQTTAAEGLTASLPLLALAGAAAGATALMPGMSVSMVLIIIGVYSQLIFTASELMHMDFTYLLPFGLFALCALVALVLTSKGIKYVFERFPGFANTAVLGFMGGSLIGILYQSLKLQEANFSWVVGIAALAVGVGISMLFVFMGRKMEKA